MSKHISWEVSVVLIAALAVSGVLCYTGHISVDWFKYLVMAVIGALIGGTLAGYKFQVEVRRMKEENNRRNGWE